MKENKIAGVYKITNNITGDFYIGSSKDIKKRWTNHKSLSVWKRHSVMKLYQAFIKYELNNFTFEVLEETADLKKREQYWIDSLKPSYNNIRANGIDIEKRKESNRRYNKAYRQAHRDECLAKTKECNSRLCFYKGETLTLNALSARFRRQGIAHPYKKANEYLMIGRDR